MHQPEDSGGTMPDVGDVDRSQFVNYSEREEYLDRDASAVALEVFGEDLRTPGMFFSAAESDHDGRAAYHPECHKVALVEIGQRNERDRWERHSEVEQTARLERAHRHVKVKQAATRRNERRVSPLSSA